MTRSILVACALCLVLFSGQAYAHDEDGHGENPLGCDPAAGETCYYAVIDDFHANPSTTDSMGEIFLTLNSARDELSYSISIDHLLSLKENAHERTEPDDIIGIHLHLYVPGTVAGPHVLNIFGLSTYGVPAEDDDDLDVDFEHQTLTGIFDISDATIDPETGQPALQNIPLTTKIIGDWLGYLDSGLLMVAVHTNESGFPTMAIHGHIIRIVPEPASGSLALAGSTLICLVARRRRPVDSLTNRNSPCFCGL